MGVESAHRMEEVAEGSVRMIDSAHHAHKLKPYRNAAHAEAAADKANLRALNKQAQRQNPQFSSNPYSRWQQKRAIKKEYMAAKTGKTGASAAKTTQKTAKSAKKAAENTKKSAGFLRRHWKGALIVLGAPSDCSLFPERCVLLLRYGTGRCFRFRSVHLPCGGCGYACGRSTVLRFGGRTAGVS